MRNDILLKLQRIIEGNDRITWDLFPEIYDGFLEADELSLAEDRMLQFVASTIQRCSDDKIISTASEEKIAEYEDVFGLSADGLTLAQRRQQVIDYTNRSRVFNETTLHELCQSLAGDNTVYERVDFHYLTLGIFTEDEDEGALPSVEIVDQIRPIVPQNLSLYAGVETSFERGVSVDHAHFSALWASLGKAERHDPRGILFGGNWTTGDDVELEAVGGNVEKYVTYKSLNELRGWSPGGDFTEDVPPVPVITSVEVNLGLRWDAGNTPASWLAKTFAAGDWWWSGILSYDDKAALESFGNSIISYTSSDYNWAGQIGALHYEPGHFSYELVDMFSDVGSGSVPFDPTNFYFDRHAYTPSGSTQYRGCMRIWAINAFNTLVKTYRVKITNKFPNDTNSTFILLGMKFNSSNSEWVNVTFATIDDGWWAGILDLTDHIKIAQLNLVENTSYPFDEVLYSPNYDYEVVGVYTDFGNTLLPGFDPANFYVAKAQNYNVICIYSHTVISTPVKTWLCKITPKVPSDSVTGTISALTLPTAHSGQYSSVMFESLRYYAKGTLSNTGVDADTIYCGRGGDWYYGTLQWTDESLGDLSDKIVISDPSALDMQPQSVFRIIFISSSTIGGYHPSDTTQENYGFISGYSYIGGVHTITLYFLNTNWIGGAYVGRIQFRYLDGVTTFKNLSAFDLINVSNGILSKATTTDRYDMYNAWNGDITVIAKYSGS